MNSKNDWRRDYLGVTAWHRAGYTGSRGLTASGEDFEHKTGHAQKTLEIFREIAPDRKVIYQMLGKVEQLTETCQAMGVDTMFVSQSTDYMPKPQRDHIDAELPERTTIFVAAGNEGDEASNAYMLADRVYGVGAVRLLPSRSTSGIPDKGAKIYVIPTAYTSRSEHINFAAPTELLLPSGRKFTGTSCSCPVLCGIAALVNDMAIAKTGRPLTDKNMIRFLADCSMDVDREGKDDLTGVGLPILPTPDEVNILKYQEGEDMQRYEDDKLIHDAHRDDVYRAQELGLMLGDERGYFDPRGALTREQAATLIVRLFEKLRKELG